MSAAADALALSGQTAALRQCFERIGATRMYGVPVMHPKLRVEAIGFEPCADEDGGPAALGVLLTPWFMNLIRLPLQGTQCAAPGQSRAYRIGAERFDFIGAHEAGFGGYEMCSLFSPMFEFADHAAARATACEVLLALRGAERARQARLAEQPRAGRRAFLTGRVASGTLP